MPVQELSLHEKSIDLSGVTKKKKRRKPKKKKKGTEEVKEEDAPDEL